MNQAVAGDWDPEWQTCRMRGAMLCQGFTSKFFQVSVLLINVLSREAAARQSPGRKPWELRVGYREPCRGEAGPQIFMHVPIWHSSLTICIALAGLIDYQIL